MASYSQVAGASRTLDGITRVVDGLRPGLSASLSFVSTDTGDIVRLGGYMIVYRYHGGELYRSSNWRLPDQTLLSGVNYQARIVNGSVEVTPHG